MQEGGSQSWCLATHLYKKQVPHKQECSWVTGTRCAHTLNSYMVFTPRTDHCGYAPENNSSTKRTARKLSSDQPSQFGKDALHMSMIPAMYIIVIWLPVT